MHFIDWLLSALIGSLTAISSWISLIEAASISNNAMNNQLGNPTGLPLGVPFKLWNSISLLCMSEQHLQNESRLVEGLLREESQAL